MMQHIKRFFILFILIFISLFNYDYRVLNAQEETQENITFIHKSSRTASILISSQNIVYSWGLWGEASNVTMSKKYVTPTNISYTIKLNNNEVTLKKGDEIIFNHMGETYSSQVFGIKGNDITVKYRRKHITIKPSDVKKIY